MANEYDLQMFASNEKGEGFYRKWRDYLESKIDADKFDLLQLNSLLFIDAWQHKPRVFTIHTNPFEYELDWGRSRFDFVLQKIHDFLPSKSILTAPSDHYAKYFSELFHKNVIPIPHAIQPGRLSHATNKRKNNSKVTILLPSRLELEQKRPQIVFEGISLLPESIRKNLVVVAGGKDPQYQDNCRKLQAIADKAGFKSQFAKFDSMADAYAAADIVALPSKSESFGYAALESLSLGIPTILNNLPTFKEIGIGNNNAYFFDQTPEAFAKCLEKVLKTPYKHHVDVDWDRRYDIELWGKNYQKLMEKAIAK